MSINLSNLSILAALHIVAFAAVSLHAYAHLAELYMLCPCGASMGDRYGPMVVAREKCSLDSLTGKNIAVPGAVVRSPAHIGRNVVLMPSFVNVGAYVDEGSMVDTWVTVGSCAQIGRNVHLSGGVGIGGVLEPLQAGPVIIEDNCFVGARSEIVEGVVVGEGSVISMGVFIGASTKIVDRNTGEIHIGKVPPYSVVVSGSLPGKPLPNGNPGPNLYCAVIVKTVDAQTRSKTGINDLLRD